MKTSHNPSVSLGDLQLEVEAATRHYKHSRTVAERANAALADAEERYLQANRALLNGVNTVRGGTKLPL